MANEYFFVMFGAPYCIELYSIIINYVGVYLW